MQIQVRVINQATGQIKQIQGALQSLDSTMARSGATAGAFGRSMDRMPLEKWGKNLQWTGRQIEYNFTLPLALAGGAAMKWALANETAMVRIQKVYGDANTTQKQMLSDTKALGRAFEALSNIYGVQQSQVLNIAADWAQAGASGAALAKQVRLTMDTMVLGEMDATKATTALIAIQSQYGLNTEQAIKTIAQLNMVENQTAISMQGLIDGFQRAAGSARAAGVDTRHLSALLAAMVPATGSAAQAGNGLRTMLSRLLAPTSAAADLLNQLGININTAGWQSKNGTQRLTELAQAFSKLTGGQQAVVSATIASRYQINRFDVLMRDILNPLGQYHRALNSTADDAKVMAQYHRELGQVLSSQPQAFKILYTQLQNAMARVIVPMLPAIIALTDKIVSMVTWFSNLNPHLQEFILAGVGIIAVVGPIIRYIGATTLLFTELYKGAIFAARAMGILATETELADGSTALYYTGIGKLIRLLGTLPGYMAEALLTPIADFIVSMGRMFAAGFVAMGRQIAAWGSVMLVEMQTALTPVYASVVAWLTALDTAVIAGFQAFLAAPAAALAALDEMVIAQLTVAYTAVVEWLTALDTAAIAGFQAFIASAVAWMAALDETVIAGITGAYTAVVEWLAALDTAVIAGFEAFLAAPMAALAALDEMFLAGLTRLWAGIVGIFEGGLSGLVVMMRTAFTSLARIAMVTIPEMFGPWGIAVLAVIALVTAFSGQIKTVFSDIGDFVIRVFNALPQGIQNAFIAVISVVRAAVETIVGWMKELNPFQRHSPSLVDNVERGHHVIAKNYHQMSTKVAAHASTAADALRDFNGATQDARSGFEDTQFASVRKDVVAAAPKAGPSFDRMVASIKALEATLPGLTRQISDQQSVVDKWSKSLDAANAKLSTAQDRLKALQATADAAKTKLDADQSSLSNLASTPIAGMKAMNDQIFSNTMAQKALQLQMMKMEDAVGPIDKLTTKMANLQGDIEKLRGEQTSLRQAGAGSDVLTAYDTQINQLQAQQQVITASAGPINALQDQLTALQRTGQELDLQNSLQFDPLTKQIQDMTSAAKEMPFDQIVAGITATQAAVAKDQTAYDAATAAVTKQQGVVDKLTATRDAAQKRYDIENAKLTALKNQYDANTSAIQNMKSAMDDFTSAANAAASAAAKAKGGSALDKQFAGAAKGSFPDPGGKGISFQGGGDINALADKWIKESKGAFGNFDMFAPIKDMFKKAWEWINQHTGGFADDAVKGMKSHMAASMVGAGVGAAVGGSFLGPFGMVLGAGIGAVVGNALAKINWGGVSKAITSGLDGVGKAMAASGLGKVLRGFAEMFSSVFKTVEGIWKYFQNNLSALGHELWDFISGLVKTIIVEFHKWSDLGKPFVEALGHLVNFAVFWFKVFLDIFKVGIAPILVIWKAAFPILINVLKPIFDLIIAVVRVAINTVHDVLKFVLDLINGDWKKALGDLLNIAKDLWNLVYAVFKAAFGLIYGIVKGFVQDIVNFFQWLYDKLVGHSILPDLINAIKALWNGLTYLPRWIWDHILSPIVDWFRGFYKDHLEGIMSTIHDVIFHPFDELKTLGSWVWTHVLSPIVSSFEDLYTKHLRSPLQTLVNGIYAVFNGVGAGIATGINVGISALDSLIGGLNFIGSHVPGLKFHIDTISKVSWTNAKPPKLAEGGMLAGANGFRTHGARAIVGEGNPAHPEYVIPTDPRYRNRAMGLLHGLLRDMHQGRGAGSYTGQTTGTVHSLPALAGGGILGHLEDAASAAWDTAKGVEKWVRKGAVMAAMAPFLKAFDAAASHIPNGLHERDTIMAFKNQAYNWMKGEDGKKRANPGYQPAPPSPNSNMSQALPTSPGVQRWMDTTAQVLIEMGRSIQYIPVVQRRMALESGGDPNAVNRWDINWKMGHPSVGLMQVIHGTFDAYAGKYRNVGPFLYGVSTNPKANIWAALHYAEKEYGNIAAIDPLTHPGGYASGGILGIPNLAEGAYIKRRAGGVLVRVGEGQHDEVVQPLPRGLNTGSTTNNYFSGNLEFPNIKSGDDAEEFLRNLEAVI